MNKEHYKYLRQLTKIRDCAIGIRSRADALYCDFVRKTDKEKDDFLDDIDKAGDSFTDIVGNIGLIYDAYDSIIGLSYPLHAAPVTIYAPVREDTRKDCVGAEPKSWAEHDAEVRVNEFYGEDLSILWNAIQLIDWPHLCDEYRHLDEKKKELYILKPYCKGTEILVDAGWTDNEIVVARTHLYTLSGKLKRAWKGMTKSLKVSDDSWCDLVNHVIGCGAKAIVDVMDDFDLLFKYNKEKEESFAYCFFKR